MTAISFMCRCLKHSYNAVSPKAIKYTLTGNGDASKEEIQLHHSPIPSKYAYMTWLWK